MKSDIEIARETPLLPVAQIAEGMGVPEDCLEPYGRYIAKVPYTLIDEKKVRAGRLILVTAITPTKTGVGKTTVSVGLALGLARIGRKAVVALREPSLGPCFGMKGGAAGGGYAQVLPMEKINLHFTGDFHAITAANNMIAALLDNYLYQHQSEGFALKEILWKRVMDINDRSLRHVVTGLGAYSNGLPQESGFDITPASELMAILCLSRDMDDLRRRVDHMLLGYTIDNKPFTVGELGIGGAVAVLLKDALHPNLVQTTEHTPAFIHGGPFANIAHGCNSVIATKMALTYGDYAITEAGFGADLGAEKFFDIKCRNAGIQPALTVIVATVQGLKMHGDVPEKDLRVPDVEGVRRGLANLKRHIVNVRSFGQSVVVCFNHFATDAEEEIAVVRDWCREKGVPFAVNDAFLKGGEGAEELARLVVKTIDEHPSEPLRYAYPLDVPIEEKIAMVARNIYGAASVTFSPEARKRLEKIRQLDCGRFPVCIAKTQYSFSSDPKRYGVPRDFNFNIKDIVVNMGAELIVAIAGDIIRMPGLPKSPQALRIDIRDGQIEGLS